MHFIVYINILFGFVDGIKDTDSLVSGKDYEGTQKEIICTEYMF